ncbi:Protein of unknown function [Nakamurella panacisegetis]|uniref:YlxR domain-containing protein n=1 Tax=Nakamurella panacisegetis TaxID=1090615 RepID=A0A1H0SJN5_9ACTN|nr:YlxR family protein [Nakamurella panacisegetis]SDP41954.1 Protein of unknown function [Nakamurella panacisegetis]
MLGPIRTCVGCRDKADASTLLRVVVVDGVITPDPRHRLPGRGAWLHPRAECLDLAERRRAFGRALRFSSAGSDSAGEATRGGAGGSADVSEVRTFLTPKAGRPS